MELLDASSMVNLTIQSGDEAVDFVKNRTTLDLTFYESGNAVWKLCALQKKMSYEAARSLVETISRLIKKTRTLSFFELESDGVMKLALDERLAYYDAAYIYAAKSRSLILVTDDTQLAKAASKHVKIKNSRELQHT